MSSIMILLFFLLFYKSNIFFVCLFPALSFNPCLFNLLSILIRIIFWRTVQWTKFVYRSICYYFMVRYGENSQLTCRRGKYKLIYPVSVSVRIWLASSCRQIHSPWLEDLVNSGIGLTLSPQSRTMNFATDLKESAREYWLMYRGAGFFRFRIIWPLVLFK
jgi:hypothetical protein